MNNPTISEDVRKQLEAIKTRITQRLGGPQATQLVHDLEELAFAIAKDVALQISPDFLDPFVGAGIDKLKPMLEGMIDEAIRKALPPPAPAAPFSFEQIAPHVESLLATKLEAFRSSLHATPAPSSSAT